MDRFDGTYDNDRYGHERGPRNPESTSISTMDPCSPSDMDLSDSHGIQESHSPLGEYGDTYNLSTHISMTSLPLSARDQDSDGSRASNGAAPVVGLKTEQYSSTASPSPDDASWLPSSLSVTYLITVAMISTALAIVCLGITLASKKNDGLAYSHLTWTFQFAVSFLPTLVSVLYALLWIPIVKDVLRTESWALLARPNGASASESILLSDDDRKSPIFDLLRCFQRRNRPIRWAALIAILGNIVASAILNPLSAGVLQVANITTSAQNNFQTVDLPNNTGLNPSSPDVTYIRAIANLAYDIPTSAWIAGSSSYLAIPFWPLDATPALLGFPLANASQQWVGETNIFQLQLDCTPFTSVKPFGNSNDTDTVLLLTDDGCTLNFTVPFDANPGISQPAGGMWGKFKVRDISPHI
jgi:hypothetical protein